MGAECPGMKFNRDELYSKKRIDRISRHCHTKQVAFTPRDHMYCWVDTQHWPSHAAKFCSYCQFHEKNFERIFLHAFNKLEWIQRHEYINRNHLVRYIFWRAVMVIFVVNIFLLFKWGRFMKEQDFNLKFLPQETFLEKMKLKVHHIHKFSHYKRQNI